MKPTVVTLRIEASVEAVNEPVGDPTPAAMAIDYYTLLNRYGRSVARSRTTRLIDFITLLTPVAEEDLQRHNIQYGLLREAPSLWSAP
jgi:hypothetical protein